MSLPLNHWVQGDATGFPMLQASQSQQRPLKCPHCRVCAEAQGSVWWDKKDEMPPALSMSTAEILMHRDAKCKFLINSILVIGASEFFYGRMKIFVLTCFPRASALTLQKVSYGKVFLPLEDVLVPKMPCPPSAVPASLGQLLLLL